MTLGELIAALEKLNPELEVPLGFGEPHSYRGDYYDLAFEPKRNVTVGEMLADAKSALGTTYQGYKGGDFTMNEWTTCWLAEYGSTGETIGPYFLGLLLATAERVVERISPA